MGRDRWTEKLAARCISSELGLDVDAHDDNSEPSMYDLNIRYPGRSPGAVEVTAAADPDSIALGRSIYDRERWIQPNLAGGWLAHLEPTARWKDVKAELPGIFFARSREASATRVPTSGGSRNRTTPRCRHWASRTCFSPTALTTPASST